MTIVQIGIDIEPEKESEMDAETVGVVSVCQRWRRRFFQVARGPDFQISITLLQRRGQAPLQDEIQGGVQCIFAGRGKITFFDRTYVAVVQDDAKSLSSTERALP